MDIVKRLRKKLFMQYESETTAIADEAADEIERLREALNKMQRSKDRYRQAWEAERARAWLKGDE